MTTPRDGNRPPVDLDIRHETGVLAAAPPRSSHPVLFVVLAYARSWAWVVPPRDPRGHRGGRPGLAHPSARRARTVAGRGGVHGAGVPAAARFTRFSGVPAAWGLLGVAAVVVVGGLGEETGWRGYLQPTLQRRFGVLAATGLVAVTWAAWHAPLFWLIGTDEDLPPAMLPLFVGGLAAASVVLAWLYNRTRSVLACAVWHGTCTLAGATAASAGAGVIAAAIWIVVVGPAAVLLVLHRRATRCGRRSVLAP